MFHEVKKPFEGDGAQRLPGEALDPTQYRNGQRLVEQRYLSPFAAEGEPKSCKCGRLWFTQNLEHDCTVAEKKKPATAAAGV